MVNKQKILNYGLIVLISASILFCTWLVFLHPHGFYNMFIRPRTFEPFTNEEFTQICPILEEIGGYDICTQEDIQTERDLYAILETLVSNGFLKSFEDWDYYFGEFEETCSGPGLNGQDFETYRCIYDLKKGSAFYRIMVFFYGNNEVKEVRETGGN